MKTTISIIVTIALLALTSCIHEDDTPVKIAPIDGAVLSPEIGGPAEPNQIWVQLSAEPDQAMKATPREAWDLGFYCGNEFRVMLNSSLVMSVGKIENAYNIDAVNSQNIGDMTDWVQVGNFQDNSQYVDNPNGEILTQTSGIAEINANDNFNNVYLLNMGYKAYTGTTVPGSIYSIGEERGWKKIRILRTNGGYKIQYANLDETTHQEFTITKDADYNYKFFSIIKGALADVQPKKNSWDLCFTVFTNTILNPVNNLLTSYIFPDFVVTNTLGNVGGYEVTTAAGQGETAYNNFKAQDVDPTKFAMHDQRTIGSNWRTTTGTNGAEVFSNKFYVVKNGDGFYFKLRFLRMKNKEGYRGYPQFEYKAL